MKIRRLICSNELINSLNLQTKVAQVGFDWIDWMGAFNKVHEELNEVKIAKNMAGESINSAELQEEIGDLIFSAVNLARKLHINPEKALRKSSNKFKLRFKHLDYLVKKQNKHIKNLTLHEMEELWTQAKHYEMSQKKKEKQLQDYY